VLFRSLHRLTTENSDDDGWIYASKLGSLIAKQYPDFDVRNFGHSKFFQFIDSLDLFETKRTSTDLCFKLK
jgi:hypothetical protein